MPKFSLKTKMKKIWSKVSLLILSGFILACLVPATPVTVNAADTDSFNVKKWLTIGGQDHSYLEATNPTAAFIVEIINAILKIISAVVLLMFITGGLFLITAQGDSNQVQRGKEILTNAIIGFLIVLSAFFIVMSVQYLLYKKADTGFHFTPTAFAEDVPVEVKFLEPLGDWPDDTLKADSPTEFFKKYISEIYKWGASLVGIVAVLNIVLSGFQIMASQGGDTASAKTRIFQSLAGLAILFLSGLILHLINPNFFIK